MRAVTSSSTASAIAGPSGGGSARQTPIPALGTRIEGTEGPPTGTGGQKKRGTTSSLQKAVMEQLEVYQAMNDLAGGAGKSGS
jgi:hypothetical protein